MDIYRPAFAEAEYRARLSSVQAGMAAQGLPALLVTSRADLWYLTGFENCYAVAYLAALVPAQGDPVLLSSRFEILNAEAGAWPRDRATFGVFDDPVAETARVLHERGLDSGRLGVQPHDLTAARYHALQQAVPRATLVDIGDLIANLKIVKSPAEIEYMREASRISTVGMQAALDAVQPGASDNDVAAAASGVMLAAGSEFMCLDPIVTVGRRSGIPHSTYRRTPIETGAAVLIEVGGCYNRYNAPAMRSAIIGPVPAAIERAAEACRTSLAALIDAMHPGALASEVARIAKQAWMPICEELVWHGYYGYSVGVGYPPDWSDGPAYITETSDLILQPGMCFHTSTSLRQPLEFGTACSETVLITPNGAEVLTGTSRDLHVV